MKKLMIFSIFIATFFISCKTQQKSIGYTYDDVYSNGSEPAQIASKPKIQNNDFSSSGSTTFTDSSSVKSKAASTSQVDYSKNSYAAKIKMSNDKNPGSGNENYTKSSDSTSSSGGASPNVNLYLGDYWGSPFWGPSFSFGWGYGWDDFGFGFGYPYYWGYPYYYYPYFGYSYWGYPYWGGGWHGHHYWDWGNGNYFYGQRTISSPNNGGKNARTTTSSNNIGTSQTKNPRTANPGNVNRSVDQTRSVQTNNNRVSPDKQRYNYVRSQTQSNARGIKNIQDNRANSTRNYAQRQQSAPKYARPGTEQQMSHPNTQAYSSPAYRQPKSSQEYINPRAQQGRSNGVSENFNRNGNYNNATSGRRYSSPSYNGNNSRVYSNPYGGSRFYNTPSRGYSSPGYGSTRSSGSRLSPLLHALPLRHHIQAAGVAAVEDTDNPI